MLQMYIRTYIQVKVSCHVGFNTIILYGEIFALCNFRERMNSQDFVILFSLMPDFGSFNIFASPPYCSALVVCLSDTWSQESICAGIKGTHVFLFY